LLALLSKLLSVCVLLIFSFAPILADSTIREDAKLLPERVGDFRAVGAARPSSDFAERKESYEAETALSRTYRLASGEKFRVELFKARTDRGAYALFSHEAQKLSAQSTRLEEVGTAALIDSSGRALIYKGLIFVSIFDESVEKNSEKLTAFAKLLAEPLDKGEGEIPVLVKHLPEWEQAQQRAVYALNLPALQEAAGSRPVLDAINFAGGAEAVTATYGSSRLVIVEHTTPQLATDNNARINARINELKNSGQAMPSAYRRVGNYAVFVFDAPDEATAAQLIDKIAYEQVVQWLGNNPRLLERAQREYSETTAGVILSVIKASGLSLLICLGIGGIFGSIIFRRRRAQQATSEAYSDAGGMLRLNIDEMTPKVDPSRLLGKGDR
jgi:uncharacterized protein with GYD domain